MVEINNTTKQKINLIKTRKIVDNFLRVYKKGDRDVSVALIGAKRMRALNETYRGINKPTDVLSFSGQIAEKKYLGEVLINLEELKRPGKYLDVFASKKTPTYIFYFLLVHGLLHLVGYNDKTETGRQEMIARGKNFLEKYL